MPLKTENDELRKLLEASNEELSTVKQQRDALVAAQQWQPIETAPKDGTEILLYRPLAGKTHDPIIGIYRGVPRDNGCWEETIPPGMSGENYTSGFCKPTHWMPLPTAPAGEKGGAV